MTTEMSKFSETIMLQKYSHVKPDGNKESWDNIAYRVSKNVLKSVHAPKDQVQRTHEIIRDRKFIPGGRYLYATGRQYHQVNNCFAGDERFVTSEGSFSFKETVGKNVMVRGLSGEWEPAEVKCFGKQRLFEMVLSNGDSIFTTEGHLWVQADGSRTKTLDTKRVLQSLCSEFPDLDIEGIRHGIIFGDGHIHPKTGYSEIIFVNSEKDESLVSYFESGEKEITVGFGAIRRYPIIRKVKAGTKVGFQPDHYKQIPETYSPSYARGFIAGLIATDGHVSKKGSVIISCEGLEKARLIREVAVAAGCVITSVRVVSEVNPFTGERRQLSNIYIKPFSAPIILPSHKDNVGGRRFYKREMFLNVKSVKDTGRDEEVFCVVAPRTNSFTLANGVLTGNCFLFKAEDSREGWADLMEKATLALMSGGGIGVDYSDIRGEGKLIRKTGGTSTGPIALAQMCNEAGRFIMQGGSRRSAIWAGLKWSHPDIQKFITLKNWTPEVRAMKSADFNFPATMDGTNISVLLDDEFFGAYNDEKNPLYSQAQSVYWTTVRQMLKTGEPGFSIDTGKNSKETLRNACTEVSSEDDSDVCNLGSINMARIESLAEMSEVVELAVAFLLAGTVYSDIPFAKVDQVRSRNRRLGLGLMGLHEWLLLHGKKYAPDAELDEYLKIYAQSTAKAKVYAKKWELSAPIKTRAVAPTGTIGILGETSTGAEPLFCVAYKRRYLKGSTWHYQYVVDPTAKRLMDSGVPEDRIEDAYSLAEDVERRVAFQAWLQQYVDHSISSTINLPQWGSEINNDSTVRHFGDIFIKYLPKLRGLTVYPDGARGGQPLTPVKLSTALAHLGEVFFESADICDITKSGGTCGS